MGSAWTDMSEFLTSNTKKNLIYTCPEISDFLLKFEDIHTTVNALTV
jgi:hypothetical protein